MINGFLVEINNTSADEQTVALFHETGLPEEVSVTTVNNKFDYHALLLMAKTKGFMGSEYIMDDDRINQIEIFNSNKSTFIDFHRIVKNQHIVIDGNSDYLRCTIPPKSVILLQLLPAFR
jgi:hypothetical protein